MADKFAEALGTLRTCVTLSSSTHHGHAALDLVEAVVEAAQAILDSERVNRLLAGDDEAYRLLVRLHTAEEALHSQASDEGSKDGQPART